MTWLIVTDLDGTLLDDTYPLAEAGMALDTICGEFPGTTVALASSKTLPEMLALASHAGQPPALIFENGAGLALPSGPDDLYEAIPLGTPYAEICTALYELQQESAFRFRGFHQMSRHEVAELTGLTPAAAALARRRLASEPLIWGGTADALRQFGTALADRGLRLQKGGRFHHVTGHVSKAQALAVLLERTAVSGASRPTTLACGDSPNDLELIDAADYALLFPQRDGRYLRNEDAHLKHAAVAGPQAWLTGVRQILDTGNR